MTPASSTRMLQIVLLAFVCNDSSGMRASINDELLSKSTVVDEGHALTSQSHTALVRTQGNFSVGTELVVDPYFAGTSMGIMALASVANAVISGVRLHNVKSSMELHDAVVTSISEHRSDVCLLTRTFEMEATLANALVIGFFDSAVQPHSPGDLPTGLEAATLENVDKKVQAGLKPLQADIKKLVRSLDATLDRLVQTACHAKGSNELILTEKLTDLQERTKTLENEMWNNGLTMFSEVASSLDGIKNIQQLIGAAKQADELADATSVVQLKARWDEAVKLLINDLQVVTGTKEGWGLSSGALEGLLNCLGTLAAIFVNANVWILGDDTSMLTIYNSALGLIIEGHNMLTTKDDPAMTDILTMFASLLTLADAVLSQAGAAMYPGLNYAQISLKTVAQLLAVAQNALVYAEEERELAMANSQAHSTAIGFAVSYSRSTCGGLNQAHQLASEEKEVVVRLAATLSASSTAAQLPYDSSKAADAFSAFCFRNPSVCKGLCSELSTEPVLMNAAKEHGDTLGLLYETGPVSDFAYVSRDDRDNYKKMGFQMVDGLRSLMVCRSCGGSVVFKTVLVETGDELASLRQQFANGLDVDGQKLPSSATLNFVQYSPSHYQIGFYKAMVDDLTSDMRGASAASQAQMLVDLRRVYIRLDNAKDQADSWRSASRAMLEEGSAVVMGWNKESAALSTFLQKMGSKVLEEGHAGLVARYDTYSALVATFAPIAASSAAKENNVGNSFTTEVDWRDVVPAQMKAPLTHVTVLKGCGCQLLFASQYTNVRPGCSRGELCNVRVLKLFGPNYQSQQARCGRSVAMWLSSDPITIPADKGSGLLGCEKLQEQQLPSSVLSTAQVDVDEILGDVQGRIPGEKEYLRVRRWWTVADTPALATITIPDVLDDSGWAHTAEYVLFQKVDGGSVDFQKDAAFSKFGLENYLAELGLGGPVASLVTGLGNVLCEDGDAAACAFADESIKDAIATSLAPIALVAPDVWSDVADFKAAKGSHMLLGDDISEWKDCKTPVEWPSVSAGTLSQLEAQLGGSVPVAAGSAKLPPALKDLLEASYTSNCDISLWTVVSVCDGGKRGYIDVEDSTGLLKTLCGGSIEATDKWMGPVDSVFLRMSFGDGSEGAWTKRDGAADDIATRDGFVMANAAGTDPYVSSESWDGKWWMTKKRQMRIQAYVQLDPRIAVNREQTCKNGKPENTWPDLVAL